MIKKLLAAGAVCMLSALPAQAGPGDNPSNAISADTVAAAIEKLGYSAWTNRDDQGDPHIVVIDKPDNVAKMAVFFDDCGSAGCEDVTFYAGYAPTANATLAKMNEWNHITSNLRSTASISGGGASPAGEPGISMTVSFLTDDDLDDMAWLAGIFVVESQMFAASIAN